MKYGQSQSEMKNELFFLITLLSISSAAPCRCGSGWHMSKTQAYASQLRQFALKAIEIDWNYVPRGWDEFNGRNFTAADRIYTDRRVYRKCVFVLNNDSMPTGAPVLGTRGLLGPPLHTLVGDAVQVTVTNACSFNISFHAHGWQYDKASEGAPSNDGAGFKPGDSIVPGGVQTYNFTVPESAGPATDTDDDDSDLSTTLWAYHSHVRAARDENAGLVGPIVVGRPADCDWVTGMPLDVDVEHFSLWTVFDESLSRLAAQNNVTEADEAHLKHAINGFLFANGPQFEARVGQVNRWYLLGFGDERDIHTVHWHGATVRDGRRAVDVVAVFPAIFRTVDMVPQVPGRWPLHCHVNDHQRSGMNAFFNVRANTVDAICAGVPSDAAPRSICVNDTLLTISCASPASVEPFVASENSALKCYSQPTNVVAVLVGVIGAICVVLCLASYVWFLRRRRRAAFVGNS
jgi:hypothetical protein